VCFFWGGASERVLRVCASLYRFMYLIDLLVYLIEYRFMHLIDLLVYLIEYRFMHLIDLLVYLIEQR